jgi:hypothetical protein
VILNAADASPSNKIRRYLEICVSRMHRHGEAEQYWCAGLTTHR